MDLDLSQFHATFFEESSEALEEMESALLKLCPGEVDAELINTIFRVAHSIKGGAATFGFADITSFTHILETYLDALRGARLQVSQPGIDLLLKSVDLLRSMLVSVQQGKAADQQQQADLQFDLECLLQAADPLAGPNAQWDRCAAVASPNAGGRDRGAPGEPTISGWRIDFKTHSELFRYGNDPLRMFAELQRLGTLQTSVDLGNLPSLEAMDPEQCYLAWELSLQGDVAKPDVEEIFEWVADDCELSITPLGATSEPQLPSEPLPQTSAVVTDECTAKQESACSQAGSVDSGSIRVRIEKIDELINMVSELVITQSMLNELGNNSGAADVDRLQTGLSQLERNTRELQESVMRMRMLPIHVVFNRFPRMVRDLSRTLDKQVELVVSGEHTELDKTVLEKIGDPLVHLLRNAIDHGIEMPSVRREQGKPETGVLHLDAFHKGGSITIRLSDDGSGLDREKILIKAKSQGLLGDETLNDEAICDLIFYPGFSTADQPTDLSGRGVGMDVVRKNIRELGGSVEVSSVMGEGTTFTIVLPLTLAIVDGQSVAVGDENYIIPLVSIIESLQLRAELLGRVAGRNAVFLFREEYVPLLYLDDLFGTRIRAQSLTEGLVVVVESEDRRVGIFVDDLLGQQQVVIKSLEENYHKVAGISGATILGGGSVALILDIPDLIRIAHERNAA